MFVVGLSGTDWYELDIILGEEDDGDLWESVLSYALCIWKPKTGAILRIGRCSHWLRPHQTRWTADGGFARPVGYGNGYGFSRTGLPQLDWPITYIWDGINWQRDGRESSKTAKPDLRIAIPARTRRHPQAAIHTRWRVKREFRVEFYGFRLKEDGWECTADSSIGRERGRGRKPRGHRQKR